MAKNNININLEMQKTLNYIREIHGEKLRNQEAIELALKLVQEQRVLLCEFFVFFRDNGEANIGMTIEQFVDGFLASANEC